MTKLPVVSGRDAVRVFGKLGYAFDRQRGSHRILCQVAPPRLYLVHTVMRTCNAAENSYQTIAGLPTDLSRGLTTRLRRGHELGLSRRRFVGTVAGAASGALVVGCDPRARSWVTAAHAAGSPLRKLPKLDGTLQEDRASREVAAVGHGRKEYARGNVLTPGPGILTETGGA